MRRQKEKRGSSRSRNDSGNTPVHWGCEHGHPETTDFTQQPRQTESLERGQSSLWGGGGRPHSPWWWKWPRETHAKISPVMTVVLKKKQGGGVGGGGELELKERVGMNKNIMLWKYLITLPQKSLHYILFWNWGVFFLNYSMLLVKLLSFLKAFNLLWPNILILYMGLIQFGWL